jgi:hypothetical protein
MSHESTMTIERFNLPAPHAVAWTDSHRQSNQRPSKRSRVGLFPGKPTRLAAAGDTLPNQRLTPCLRNNLYCRLRLNLA